MSLLTVAIVSFLTGIFASLGLGGGTVLIIYLTVFMGTEQIQAQGINLIFFLPIAAVSLIIHTKNKLVEWKKTVPILITGTVSVIISSIMANNMESDMLRKCFGWFIVAAGIKELFFLKGTDHKVKGVKKPS